MAAIELNLAKYLENLKNFGDGGETEEEFADLFSETFTTINNSGEEVRCKRSLGDIFLIIFYFLKVELIPNGRSKSVTLSSKRQFIDLVITYRLGVFQKNIDAIMKGIGLRFDLIAISFLKYFYCYSSIISRLDSTS